MHGIVAARSDNMLDPGHGITAAHSGQSRWAGPRPPGSHLDRTDGHVELMTNGDHTDGTSEPSPPGTRRNDAGGAVRQSRWIR
jgi:hypothetical protein